MVSYRVPISRRGAEGHLKDQQLAEVLSSVVVMVRIFVMLFFACLQSHTQQRTLLTVTASLICLTPQSSCWPRCLDFATRCCAHQLFFRDVTYSTSCALSFSCQLYVASLQTLSSGR